MYMYITLFCCLCNGFPVIYLALFVFCFSRCIREPMTINTVLLSCFSVFSTQLETMAPRPDVLLQNVLQNVANGKQNVLDKTHKGQAVLECISIM